VDDEELPIPNYTHYYYCSVERVVPMIPMMIHSWSSSESELKTRGKRVNIIIRLSLRARAMRWTRSAEISTSNEVTESNRGTGG
jgi:hypothetical protein